MSPAHLHPAPAAGPGPAASAAATAVLLSAVAYVVAAARLRRRGDAWSPWRDVSFAAGACGVAWAAVGAPGAPGGPFTSHVVRHLVVAMAAPLPLVLARPLTLVLRSLGPGRIRRGLVTVARSRLAGWAAFPPWAALVDVGGLWLLYRTELFAVLGDRPVPHAVVHAHMAAAGLLFTWSVCQLDPVRHRWGTALRGVTLLAAGAAHAALAKSLYAVPPPGTAVPAADLQAGAQLMYYGGDVAEAALAVVLGVGWYTASGRARARPLRPRTA